MHLQESIDSWWNMRERLIKGDIPSLVGKGAEDDELRNCISQHYKDVNEYFATLAPDRFLSYHLKEDNLDKLKDFLGSYDNYTMKHFHDTKQVGLTARKMETERHKHANLKPFTIITT